MPESTLSPRHRRQKTLLVVFAIALMLAGIVIALFLHRIVLPLRIAMGFVDFIAGATLLVFVRQNFSRRG